MSAISDLTDYITGGADEQAQQDLENVLNEIQGIQTPGDAQLQLGPLAQYTDTGNLSPALATAAQAGPSAFNNENISQAPLSTMQQALAQEAALATQATGGETPQEQAAIAEAEAAANENQAGQEGAIQAQFEGQGDPASLVAAALEQGAAGQNAQNAYLADMAAQGNAAQEGVQALANEQAGAQSLYSTEANQANTVAQAQNALNQFNAANLQQTALANQANQQAANTYNTTTAQNLEEQNVSGANQALYQNEVQAPQEAASLALEKGSEEAGVGEAEAQQQMEQGQQAAGLFGGLLGAGASLGGDLMLSNSISSLAPAAAPAAATTAVPIPNADGGEIPPKPVAPAIPFLRGGRVPGRAVVSGNDPANDTVPAQLSPGEFVVPRTAMADPRVRGWLAKNVPTPRPPTNPHLSDVASLMRAMAMLRAGRQS